MHIHLAFQGLRKVVCFCGLYGVFETKVDIPTTMNTYEFKILLDP